MRVRPGYRISVSHLYNLRASEPYRKQRLV